MAYGYNEKLPEGAILKTISGLRDDGAHEVIVQSLLSNKGGQGDVYKVMLGDKAYALKWYNRTPVDAVGSDQFNTIKTLTNKNNPNESFFIWPEILITESGDIQPNTNQLFGYIMELIPSGYYEMEDYLRSGDDEKQAKLKTFHAMIWAGLNTVSAVQSLHHAGMSYKDLNPGNIVIEPVSGNIKMVDCDNISYDNAPCSINGMRGYMAPEIVRSGFRQTPNIQTDMFSLAIILFRLFYMDHPMEGKLWERVPLVTDKVEDELYCIHPVYNMSSKTDINRPTDVYAPNVKQRMALLPWCLIEGFENTFVNGINNVTGRTPENRWMKILTEARDQLVFMDPKLEKDRVVRFEMPESIPKGCLRMRIKANQLAVYPYQSLFKNTITNNPEDYRERIATFMVYQGRLCIVNMSDQKWLVLDPVTQKTRYIEPKQFIYVLPGMKIAFDIERKITGVIDNPLVK